MEWDGCNGDSSIILSDLHRRLQWIMMKARRWESLYPSEGQRSDHRAGHYFEGWFLLRAKMSILLIGSFGFFLFFPSDLIKRVDVGDASHATCIKHFFSLHRVLCLNLKQPFFFIYLNESLLWMWVQRFVLLAHGQEEDCCISSSRSEWSSHVLSFLLSGVHQSKWRIFPSVWPFRCASHSSRMLPPPLQRHRAATGPSGPIKNG